MSSTDKIAMLAALVALLGVLASIWAGWWQARKQWLLNSANLVTTLVDQFNSPGYEKRRAKFVDNLLKPIGDSERTLIGNYGFGVLGFYENIGHLVKRGAIDLFMVHNKFAWEIVCYYQLICPNAENDLLEEIRRRYDDDTQYMEFKWLNDEMVKKYQELGTKVYDAKGRVKWMDDFILQESTLIDKQVFQN